MSVARAQAAGGGAPGGVDGGQATSRRSSGHLIQASNRSLETSSVRRVRRPPCARYGYSRSRGALCLPMRRRMETAALREGRRSGGARRARATMQTGAPLPDSNKHDVCRWKIRACEEETLEQKSRQALLTRGRWGCRGKSRVLPALEA